MSNKIPSSPTPPKGPQELSPESIPAKQGWKRAVETGETKTVSRAAEPKSKEAKPIAERSMASSNTSSTEVAEAEKADIGTFDDQTLTNDIIMGHVSRYVDVSTYGSLVQTSKTLTQLANNTDFETLRTLNKNNQLTSKEQLSLVILEACQNSLSENIEDIGAKDLKKAATVDTSLTVKEASSEKKLAEVEANYKEIQTVYNRLLKSSKVFITPVAEFVVISAAATFLYNVGYMDSPMILAAAVAPSAVAAFDLYSSAPESLALFKTATAGIMSSLTQNISPSSKT